MFYIRLNRCLVGKRHKCSRKQFPPPQYGTLGIFFEISIDGKRKFVKSHLTGAEYRENLLKEAEILSTVYKNIIEIEKVDVKTNGNQFTFMIMDYLFHYNRIFELDEVKKYIKYYHEKLSGQNIKARYCFSQVLKAGAESLKTLYESGLLSGETHRCCQNSLYRITEKSPESDTLCHGDLSNANIMYTENRNPIVIDWEDSLMAFKEYDYLYWMTFFSQRKYYSRDFFSAMGIDKIWGTDIMILITVIKSYISFLNGSYKKNLISFDDRIREIANIAR